MSRAAVIGQTGRVEGYGLAGVLVFQADSPAAAVAALESLPPDVAVVVLTALAAQWLADRRAPAEVLMAVMPS